MPLLVADVVQRADVGVVELGDGAGLALEAGAELRAGRQVGGQHLDRHVAAQAGVVGAVDLAHPARADRGDDLVRAEPRAGGERHPISASCFSSGGERAVNHCTPGGELG